MPADLPPVRGDRVHLQQVLLNLILNGMDALDGASRADRRVSVTARLDGAQTVEIAVSHRQRHPRRQARARLRSLFHYQAERSGHGPADLAHDH